MERALCGSITRENLENIHDEELFVLLEESAG